MNVIAPAAVAAFVRCGRYVSTRRATAFLGILLVNRASGTCPAIATIQTAQTVLDTAT